VIMKRRHFPQLSTLLPFAVVTTSGIRDSDR
jgi:hypothetical protein